jgi:hypothetical protein
MPEHDELVAVVAVQAVLGAEPHEAAGVLDNGLDGVLREAVGDGEMAEGDAVLLCGEGPRVPEQERNDQENWPGPESQRAAMAECPLGQAGGVEPTLQQQLKT